MQNNLVGSRQYAVGRKLSTYCLLLTACCLLLSCSTKDAKHQQYYVRGQQLYIKNCANCHQKNGAGLGLLYPPIAESNFIPNNLEEVLCLMRHGKQGELEVNGKRYNKTMPAMPSLTDLEIAEIATYIYNEWGHRQGIIDVKDVSPALAKCE